MNAIVYCEGAFATTYGKTAHGLVRFTERYTVCAVIDSTLPAGDAGEFLDGKKSGIPLVADLDKALARVPDYPGTPPRLVVGLALEGRVLPPGLHDTALDALKRGIGIDSGLHLYLGELPDLARAAADSGVEIRDIRRPPRVEELHFFSSRIEKVRAVRIAVLGTDSALGKRTTAWKIVHAIKKRGRSCEMIGTGQTAWLQGARYSIILDSIVNDFVAGEIEDVICKAWNEQQPDYMIIEGQGSLMNPAFPGGFEILAAGRPDAVILQHAPGRPEYDGFPGYPIQPLDQQIKVIELLSGKKVIAVAINHENLPIETIGQVCEDIEKETGLPTVDPILQGAEILVTKILALPRE